MSNNRAFKPRTDRFELEFKFSNFQALQVPRGWDKLSLCLVHVETGKTMAKLGKGVVRNGSCQWSETLSESVSVLRNDDSGKGFHESLVKLVVFSGSTRSSTLGELTINVASYASSRTPSAVSQPLKKCIYGTVLLFKIHCQTSRSKNGGEELKSSSSQEKVINMCSVDSDIRSHKSDNSSDSKGVSQFDSLEGIPVYETVSVISSPQYCKNEETVKRTSKHLPEASEDNIDELRAEAKMWERNARRLMADLDISRNELSEMSKTHSELEAEQEKLKVEFGKTKADQHARDSMVQSENLNHIQKLLESEMKYQRDLNDDLGQQLKRSQESNVELVTVLQELEETIEQQRTEIEKSKVKIEELENERKSKEEEIASLEATLSGYVKGEHFEALDDDNGNYDSDLVREVELLRSKVEELEKDCAELTEENLELLLKLKDSNKIIDIRKCTSFDSMSCESETSGATDERRREEMENSLSGLQEENTRLKGHVSELESQIRQLEDAKESCQKESDHFESVAKRLEHESLDMQKQLLFTQEECNKSETKIQDLTCQLEASKKSHEMALKLIENHKGSEEKLKSDLKEVESKWQQLTKEIDALKAESGNKQGLEDEIANIKVELNGCKVAKRKLELALKAVSDDNEETKAENISLSEKILDLQVVASNFDKCKRNKLVLEEKLTQMETIRIQNEELKRENTQFKKRVHRLEEEKIECLKKAKALEDEVVKLAKEKEKENVRKEGVKNHERNTLSVGQKKHHVASNKASSTQGESVRFEKTNLELETELRDLKERYLEMSLKYAEVESEREGLVMKLRASKVGKRWFS